MSSTESLPLRMYYVYVLKSKQDSFHYIGHTNSLENRIRLHNQGKVRSSGSHRPYTLIYFETYPTRSEAMKRESYLKHGEGNQWLREHLKAEGLW